MLPVTNDSAPVTNDATPVANYATPVTNDSAPVANDTTPVEIIVPHVSTLKWETFIQQFLYFNQHISQLAEERRR